MALGEKAIEVGREFWREAQLLWLAVLIVFVCVGSFSAFAQGPSRPNLWANQLSPKQFKQAKLVKLTKNIIQFRLVGVGDPQLLNKFFAAPGNAPFDLSALHQKDKNYERDLWRLFFKQSQAYLGAGLSKAPIVGFYNPIVDFWLITQWRYAGDEPQITGTMLYPGHLMRGELKAGGDVLNSVPDWLRLLEKTSKKEPLTVRAALQSLSAVSIAGFLKSYPEQSSTPPSLPKLKQNKRFIQALMTNRLKGFFKQNVRLVANTELFDAYNKTLVGLSKKDFSALKKINKPAQYRLTTLDQIKKIPLPFLQSLEPLAVMQAGENVIVLSGRSDNARFVVVTMFSKHKGQIVLDGISYYDLYARVHGS